VPALRLDDGAILTEANGLQYLADRKPESGLAPKPGTMERFRLLEALSFVSSEVHKQIGALFIPAMTDEIRSPEGTIGRRFNAHEQMLEGSKYVCGDTFTIADAYLFTVLNWTGMLQIDTAQWPHIRAYMRASRAPEVPGGDEGRRLTGLRIQPSPAKGAAGTAEPERPRSGAAEVAAAAGRPGHAGRIVKLRPVRGAEQHRQRRLVVLHALGDELAVERIAALRFARESVDLAQRARVRAAGRTVRVPTRRCRPTHAAQQQRAVAMQPCSL